MLHKCWHRGISMTFSFCLQDLYAFQNSLFSISVYLTYDRAVFLNFTIMLKMSSHQKWSIVFRMFGVKVKHFYLTRLHVYANEKLVNCFHRSFVNFQNFSCLVAVFLQKKGKRIFLGESFCSFIEAVMIFAGA